MKYAPRHRLLSLAVLALAAGGAFAATEYGTIVSSTPVYAQVPVGDRVCTDEVVQAPRATTGAGALAGAIIGGVVGNQIGAGAGRAAATGLGVVLGTAVGNQAEANAAGAQTTTVPRCSTSTRYEDRIVGYDVVYDYAGQRRSARLAQDPGAPGTRIALDVNVAAAAGSVSGRGTPVPPAPVYSEPAPVGDRYDPAYDRYNYAPRVVYSGPPSYYYVPAAPVVVPAPYYGYGNGYGYPAATVWIGGGWGHRRRW